jgi:hypothetical protein
LEGVVAVHFGHLAVHQDGVEAIGGEPSQRLTAVADHLDAAAAAFEHARGDDLVEPAPRRARGHAVARSRAPFVSGFSHAA